MTDRQKLEGRGRLWSPTGLALLGFLAIAAFFLFTEHRAHFGALPFLLLLLCPLLHLFTHGKHGGHGGGDGGRADRPETHKHDHHGDEK